MVIFPCTSDIYKQQCSGFVGTSSLYTLVIQGIDDYNSPTA